MTTTTTPPRWAVWAAYAVPLINLPSALWRIALVAGVPLGFDDATRLDGPGYSTSLTMYILALTVVTELVALVTLGLVRPWGEVWPRWIPLLGGRNIPRRLPPLLAYPGAVAMTAIWVFAIFNGTNRLIEVIDVSSVGEIILMVCYLPLLAWGPLLAAVTFSYQRRRRPAAAAR